MNSNFKKFLYFYLFSLSNIGFLPLVRDLEVLKRSLEDFHDLETIKPTTDMRDVEEVLVKHCSVMISAMETMKNNTSDPDKICELLIRLNTMMEKAWQVPAFGNEIGKSLSRILQSNGGLDMLIDNCDNSSNIRLQVSIFEFCYCVFAEFFQKYVFLITYSYLCTYSFSVLNYSNNAWFPRRIVDMWLRKVWIKSLTWPRNILKIQPIFNITKWVREFSNNCFVTAKSLAGT